MKPQQFGVAAGALLVLAVLLIITVKPPGVAAPLKPSERTITVIGEGEVRSKPNQVIVTVGILTHGASASEVEASLLASVARVKSALAIVGLAEGEMTVSDPELVPTTQQSAAGAPTISGYRSQVRLTATTGQIGRAQAIVDAALAVGATSVEGIRYALADPETALQQAAALALDNARKRAQALARASGNSIGELLSVEVLDQPDGPLGGDTPGNLIYQVRVRAKYEHF